MRHTLSAFALLSIVTTPLLAEESVDSTIPELPVTIVTGKLWESELQKTTASVTVIDDELLHSSGNQHFGDLINAIPNMSWSATSSRPRYIQIRGIGENSQFEGETPDSSVRFMVDDLDFTGVCIHLQQKDFTECISAIVSANAQHACFGGYCRAIGEGSR